MKDGNLEVLSSDEDEIDEASQEYLEKLEEKVNKSQNHLFSANTTIALSQDHKSDDEEDSEYEPNEETALESYVTPLDSEETNQDEYVVFKEILQSKTRIYTQKIQIGSNF